VATSTRVSTATRTAQIAGSGAVLSGPQTRSACVVMNILRPSFIHSDGPLPRPQRRVAPIAGALLRLARPSPYPGDVSKR
jgi:hypothetical protein